MTQHFESIPAGSRRSRWFWDHHIPFKQNSLLHLMIIVFGVIWVVLAIKPVDWKSWLLENAVLILGIGAVAWQYRSYTFNNFSYLLITIFCTLHAIGAHYGYRTTPLDSWLKHVFNVDRSYYDRVVHTCFGLLMAYPAWELVRRRMKLWNPWAYLVTLTLLLSATTLFELGEMVIALVTDPKLAAKYLGYQGDLLDTQKDIALGLIGGIISIGLIFIYKKKRE